MIIFYNTCTAPKKWVLLWNYIRTALLNGEKKKSNGFSSLCFSSFGWCMNTDSTLHKKSWMYFFFISTDLDNKHIHGSAS